MTKTKPKQRALFPYPGSKWRLMPHVVRLLPNHEHYVSLFGGSGADILAKPKSRIETYNDLDAYVHNVFSVVLNRRVDELRRLIAATPPRSRRVFEDARSVLADKSADPVRSAWAFLVASHQGFVRVHPSLMRGCEWAFSREARKIFARWDKLPLAIDFVRRRFRHVQLEAVDWKVLVEKLDSPTTAFFADPPYYPDTMRAGQQLYACEMTVAQHEEMLDCFLRAAGHVVLCGYGNALYDDKLKGWRRIEIKTKTNMSQRDRAEDRTEVLWLNYDENGERL
jgi:DNA adenine methylase